VRAPLLCIGPLRPSPPKINCLMIIDTRTEPRTRTCYPANSRRPRNLQEVRPHVKPQPQRGTRYKEDSSDEEWDGEGKGKGKGKRRRR
jgi:hypothetical protein